MEKLCYVIAFLLVMAAIGAMSKGVYQQDQQAPQVATPQAPDTGNDFAQAVDFAQGFSVDRAGGTAEDVVIYAHEAEQAGWILRAMLRDSTHGKQAGEALATLNKRAITTLPELREKWLYHAGGPLWKQDILIDSKGKNRQTLVISSSLMVRNANVLLMQDLVEDPVKVLRFRAVRYEWYVGQHDAFVDDRPGAKDSY